MMTPRPISTPARHLQITVGATLLFWGALWFLFVPPTLSALGMLEIADLQSQSENYDRKEVAVSGKVTKVRTATNQKGKTVYGFLLQEGDSIVKVVGPGKAPVQEGERVMVEGIFRRFGRGKSSSLANEIKANLIRSLDRLHSDLVG